MPNRMILVASCLAGKKCNYRGEASPNERVMKLYRMGIALPVCPEYLAGLSTPRNGSRILNGNGKDVLEGRTKVVADDGQDWTDYFLKGARMALEAAQAKKITMAILKQGSPACGYGQTYGGMKKRERMKGIGVAAAMLEEKGVEILTEKDIMDDAVWRNILRKYG